MGYFLYFWAIIEIVLILYALYNIKKIISIYKKDKTRYYYPSDKLENVLTQVYGKHKIVSLMVSEIMVFYFALFGWFIKKRSFEGVLEYTYSKETMYGVLFWVIMGVSLIEVPVGHYFLSLWNETIAWVVTGVTLYGMIWLLGDYKAIVHYPIRLSANRLYLRIGLRAKVDMDVTNIETLTSRVDDEIKEEYEHFLLMTTVEPNVYISLKECVEVIGLFGMRKEVDKIAFYVDDYGGFTDRLNVG